MIVEAFAPSRVRGVLLGLAAGDRIGGPARMALTVATSLHARRGFDVDDVAKRHLAWWRAAGFDTGPTAGRVFQLVELGATFESAADRAHEESGGATAGCNPAHRSAPIAMSHDVADAEVAEAALAEARLTHRHPLAGDVAAAVATLCRGLIRGLAWDAALAAARAERLPETRRAMEVPSSGRLSRGGYAPDALRAAVSFISGASSLEEALSRAIQFAGPANYCPVLVGGIGGALWGDAEVGERLLEHHRDSSAAIRQAADALASAWSGGTTDG